MTGTPVAVVGCSDHSVNVHADAIVAAGGRVTAIADLDEGRRTKMIAKLRELGQPEPVAFSDAHDLFKACEDGSLAEAVFLVVPTPLHAELTLAALRVGLHVYVEKPLATSATEAAAMIHAAHEAGLVLWPGFQKPWTVPGVWDALERIRPIRSVTGEWGRPADGARLAEPYWLNPETGGATLDFCHMFELICRCFEDDPKHATAYAFRDQGRLLEGERFGAEDSSESFIGFPEGLAIVRLGWWEHRSKHLCILDIRGAGGRIVTDVPTVERRVGRLRSWLYVGRRRERIEGMRTNREAHELCTRAFLEACMRGENPPARELLTPQAVLDAARRSFANNMQISVQPPQV